MDDHMNCYPSPTRPVVVSSQGVVSVIKAAHFRLHQFASPGQPAPGTAFASPTRRETSSAWDTTALIPQIQRP